MSDKPVEIVKRYVPAMPTYVSVGNPYAACAVHPQGQFVLYSDYAAAEAKVRELEHALISERETVGGWIFANGQHGWIEDLRKENASLRERAERAEVQLAGCGAAALGWAKGEQAAKQGDYGWSASYQDVVNLREQVERLKAPVSDAECYAFQNNYGDHEVIAHLEAAMARGEFPDVWEMQVRRLIEEIAELRRKLAESSSTGVNDAGRRVLGENDEIECFERCKREAVRRGLSQAESLDTN